MNRAVTLAERLLSTSAFDDLPPEKRPQTWRQLMEAIIQGNVADPKEARRLAQSCGVMADERYKPFGFVNERGERREFFAMGRISELNGSLELSDADRRILQNKVLECADEADEWERVRDDHQLSEDQA